MGTLPARFDPQDSFDNSSSAYFWERKSRTRTPTGEDVADTAELVRSTVVAVAGAE